MTSMLGRRRELYDEPIRRSKDGTHFMPEHSSRQSFLPPFETGRFSFGGITTRSTADIPSVCMQQKFCSTVRLKHTNCTPKEQA
eukprot:scaffold371092_cov35-Attheya_sp.AAC.1